VLEPSVSDQEWLSRALATAVRDDDLTPADSGRFLKIYGVQLPPGDGEGGPGDGGSQGESPESTEDAPPKLVEPMYVARTGESLPTYDLRDVEDTLRVRVTKSEFEQA
jgi:hypothetical protein